MNLNIQLFKLSIMPNFDLFNLHEYVCSQGENESKLQFFNYMIIFLCVRVELMVLINKVQYCQIYFTDIT